ncbi:MAG: hypothetical protein WD768_01315 [Phycisphaeraceae bacterium]
MTTLGGGGIFLLPFLAAYLTFQVEHRLIKALCAAATGTMAILIINLWINGELGAGLAIALLVSMLLGALFGNDGVIHFRFRPETKPACCEGCGYNLRGTVAADGHECPECGYPISNRKAALVLHSRPEED